MNKEISVVHIDTEKYWGGGQNQVFLLHKHLIKRGVKSVVFTPSASPLLKKIKSAGLPAMPLFLRTLILFVLHHKSNVMHCHSGKSYYYGIILKMLFPKIKLVFTRRIMSIPKFIKFKAHIADHIICVSTPVMNALEKAGVSNEKMTVVYDGVEPEQQPVSQPNWFTEDAFVVGTVGSLMDYKDHYTLIKGFADFHRKFESSKLVIIGDGPEKKKLQEFVKELGIAEYVIFTGFLENAAAHIKFMLVFVITSAFAESFCTSIIDAFFAKTLVIATDTGGIYELVKDKETGVLIPVKDAERLSLELEGIYRGKVDTARLIENAYNHAQNFTAEKMCEGNMRVYES